MAVSSQYPVNGQPIVRGDPLTIPVDFKINGVEQDISTWVFRAHIRNSADAKLIDQFDFTVTTPPNGTTTSRLLLTLTADRTRKLKTGMVFDLEQLVPAATPTETLRTWWIVTRLVVAKDVSHDG
jgi:hypothetical protein